MPTQTLPINGMTCNGCVSRIQSALAALDGVNEATVTLEPPAATITTSQPVSESTIAAAISTVGSYSVGQAAPNGLLSLGGGSPSAPMSADANEKKPFRLSTYQPLILILAFLIGGTIIWHARAGNWQWESMMSVFMGGFFVVFSFFKFLDLRGFADAYRGYDVIARFIPAYGFVYPFIELLLGIAYLLNYQPMLTNIVTLIVMTVSIIGVVNSVLSGRTIRCACLGTVFNLPMSQVTIIEDGLMILMALIMLIRISAG